MQNAIAAVRALTAEQQFFAFAIEGGTPVDEAFDFGWAFFHQNANGFGIAKTIAREERVLLMQSDVVIVAERCRDATLRIFGGRFAQTVFRNDEDAPNTCQFDGGAQSRYSSSDDNKIGMNALNGWVYAFII